MILLHAEVVDLLDVAVIGEVDVVAAPAGQAHVAAALVPPLPAHAAAAPRLSGHRVNAVFNTIGGGGNRIVSLTLVGRC